MINHPIEPSTPYDLNRYGVFLLALFIVSIYLSTTISIIISAFVGLLWLITGQFRVLPVVLKNSPVMVWALLLYLCFIIGLTYGDAPKEEAYSLMGKYRELLYIPVLACFFMQESYRRWAWRAFIVASVISLACSYLMDFGLIDKARHSTFTIKSRIAHSILISYFLFYCGHRLFDKDKYQRWYLMFLILGVINLFFIVNGRTGQFCFLILTLLLPLQRFRKKELLMTIITLSVLVMLYVGFSDKSARIHEGFDNTAAYLHHTPEKTPSSMGIRYTYWGNAVKLFLEKPVLGHGTGSFAKEFGRVIPASVKVDNKSNPHNEYLLIAVQLGCLGLLCYGGFLISQYYCSKRLPIPEKWLGQGILCSLVTSSFFNSPILDHTEGHWFTMMIALCFAPWDSINSSSIHTSSQKNQASKC